MLISKILSARRTPTRHSKEHMRNTSRLVTTFAAISLSVIGCASAAAPPPAVATHAEPRSATLSAPQAAAAEPKPAAEPQGTEPAAEKPADVPRDGLRRASRPPLELLTGNNVVYMFNFGGSAKGEAAKTLCDGAGSPADVRECVEKERAKIPVESVRFVKDEHGQYWWVSYNRYKGNLLKWHKVQFMPGKEDDDTISLSLVGKDKGIAPMAHVPASLKVELPNDYSIVVRDPEFGDMMFDAKIGLMDAEPTE